MSAYSVDLSEDAEDQLADIWTRAPDRSAVTSAEVAIMKALGRDPIGQGAEVQEGLYKYRGPPLTYYYSVDLAQKTVHVEAVSFTP